MPNLELFISNTCPYCQKVFRVIDKYNLNDKVKITNVSQSKEDKNRLIEVGGMYQVPCLFIDNKPMYESSDIITYLKETLVD